MQKVKLEESKILMNDVTIRLNFEGGSWANMTFSQQRNDWTNVVIHSDWGNWTYGWGTSGMGGRTIFEFMHSFRKDLGYFIRHFTGAEKSYFNARKTCTAMRKRVKEEYPWIRYKEENENYMGMISELSGCDNEDELYSRMDKELYEFLGNEPWHYVCYESQPRSAFFFKHVFPKFFPLITKIYKEQSRDTSRNSKANRRNKESQKGKEGSLRKRNETLGSNSGQPRAFA